MSYEKTKSALIYCRVSTTDQKDNGLSIEAQESACKREIEKDGYTLIETIKDEGISGGTLNRTGIKKVIRLVSEKKVDAVYVIHSDRLARNTADHLMLRDLFRKNAVILKCLHQPTMDDSAVSRTMDTVMASFNEMQRLITSEKVMSTMTEKAMAGYYPSIAPIGYKNVKNPESLERAGQKCIALDKDKAPFVKKMFELYATGNYNGFDLNDIIYEKGLRTKQGGKLADSSIYEILKNRIYLGEIHWGSVHHKEGKHEPIVDEDTFNKVQKILASKNKHACRRRKFTWLLSGFIRCYRHNCRYTAEWHLDKKIAYYHCTNKSGCGKYTEQNKLEEMVADKFKELEFSEEFTHQIIKEARAMFYERKRSYERRKQECVNQRTAFEIKRKIAEDKLFAGIISDNDFTRIKKQLTVEIQDIDNRLASLEKERGINVDIAQEILNFTRNINDAYNKSSVQLKRQFLGFFWEHFEVADGVIIKSVPSVLFEELMKQEQVFVKDEKTKKPNVYNGVINSPIKSAQQESNLRPSP